MYVGGIVSGPVPTIAKTNALDGLKIGKCGDELGLTAELLKNVPEEFISILPALYNNVVFINDWPESWCKTLFSMLPKKRGHYNLWTSDQLLTFVYYTKHVQIFYLDDPNIFWKQDSRKNSMGFSDDDLSQPT